MGKPYRLDVSEKKGGLLLFVNRDIPSKYLQSFPIPKDIQVIPIEMILKQRKLLVISIYRPPNQNLVYFLSVITSLLDHYLKHYEDFVILGDFNETEDGNNMKSFLDEQGCENIVKAKTCFKSTEGSCIDLIVTSRPNMHQLTQVFETGLSDHHLMIYTMLKSTYTKLGPVVLKSRSYKGFSEDYFLNDLRLNLKSDGNFSNLNRDFNTVLDQHAPAKVTTLRGNTKPHVNKLLRKEIMKRSRLKNKANKSKKVEDFRKYKIQRNIVTRLNKRLKSLYFKTKLPKGREVKDFWNFCKPYFTNKVICKDENIILVENDEIIRENNKIAETFNDYFINITIDLEIFQWDNNNLINHPSIILIQQKFENTLVFGFDFVTPDLVLKHIKDLDHTKSSGGDISVKVLKLAKEVMLIPITYCINKCIMTSTFPDELKNADVIPVFKKNNPNEKGNYRPISLLPIVSKIYEKVLNDQITKFAEKVLSHKLCGFRKGYSTQTAILNLLKNWENCLDNKGVVGTVLMDLSKAYDCLPHNLLLAKLKAYGFDKSSFDLIKSYLSNRHQRVKIRSSYSSFKKVYIGVPQGSILGPILFNFFINDLMFFIEETDVCNFADDTTIYSCSSTYDEANKLLSNDTHKVLNWFKINSMVANPGKFQIMFLGSKIDNNNITFLIEDKCIKSKSEVTLLGITIDDKLTFKNHIKLMCNKANNRLRALIRIRKFLSVEQAKYLSEAYIMSSFKYCPLIWMFCNKTSNDLINNIHKRTLRVTHDMEEADFEDLLNLEKICTVHQNNLKTLIIEVYKSINKINPPIMWEFFKVKPITYNLRNDNLLILPSARSSRYGTDTLSFKGSLLWNNVPSEYKNTNDFNRFKNKIKSWNPSTCSCKICK